MPSSSWSITKPTLQLHFSSSPFHQSCWITNGNPQFFWMFRHSGTFSQDFELALLSFSPSVKFLLLFQYWLSVPLKILNYPMQRCHDFVCAHVSLCASVLNQVFYPFNSQFVPPSLSLYSPFFQWWGIFHSSIGPKQGHFPQRLEVSNCILCFSM